MSSAIVEQQQSVAQVLDLGREDHDEQQKKESNLVDDGIMLTKPDPVRAYEFKRSYLTASSKAARTSRRRAATSHLARQTSVDGGQSSTRSNKLARATTDNEEDNDDDDDDEDDEDEDLLNKFKEQVLKQQNMIYKNMKSQLRIERQKFGSGEDDEDEDSSTTDEDNAVDSGVSSRNSKLTAQQLREIRAKLIKQSRGEKRSSEATTSASGDTATRGEVVSSELSSSASTSDTDSNYDYFSNYTAIDLELDKIDLKLNRIKSIINILNSQGEAGGGAGLGGVDDETGSLVLLEQRVYVYETESDQPETCAICCEERRVNERMCCKFRACNQCVNSYIQAKIMNCSQKVPMECLNTECQQPINREEINDRMIKFDKQALNIYMNYLSELNADGKNKTCPKCCTILNIDEYVKKQRQQQQHSQHHSKPSTSSFSNSLSSSTVNVAAAAAAASTTQSSSSTQSVQQQTTAPPPSPPVESSNLANEAVLNNLNRKLNNVLANSANLAQLKQRIINHKLISSTPLSSLSLNNNANSGSTTLLSQLMAAAAATTSANKVTRVECEQCHFLWCFVCHAPWHEGLKCKEFQKGDKLLKNWSREQQAGQLNAQVCPTCKVYIQRNSGCDTMNCTCCHTEFCYKCGCKFRHIRFLGDHYSKLSVLGCKYRLYPDQPLKRKLIRGSVFGAKIAAVPFICGAGLVVGACALAASTVVVPAYGSYKIIKHIKTKKAKKNIKRVQESFSAQSGGRSSMYESTMQTTTSGASFSNSTRGIPPPPDRLYRNKPVAHIDDIIDQIIEESKKNGQDRLIGRRESHPQSSPFGGGQQLDNNNSISSSSSSSSHRGRADSQEDNTSVCNLENIFLEIDSSVKSDQQKQHQQRL